MPTQPTRHSFEDALREEHRRLHSKPSSDQDEVPTAGQTAGLAFSGGGIRSATFNLGVLQGLARLGLLRSFDYLSTVSGGGYIGGWLVNWIRRDGFDAVQERLERRNYRGPEIQHLRDYSNYLTPKKGILGADTWSVISIYLRNLVLNLLVLVALLTALLLLPYTARALFAAEWNAEFGLAPGLALFLFCLLVCAVATTSSGQLHRLRKSLRSERRLLERPGYVRWFVVLPMLAAGFCFSYYLWNEARGPNPPFQNASVVLRTGALLSMGAFVLLCILNNLRVGVSGGVRVRLKKSHLSSRHATLVDFALGALFAAIPGIVGASLLIGLVRWIPKWTAWHRIGPEWTPDDVAFVFLPFVAGLAMLTVCVLMLGVLGRISSEKMREWSSRAGGSITLWATLITVLGLLSLFSPHLARWLWDTAWTTDSTLNKAITGAIASGWIGTTIGAVLLGKGDNTHASRPRLAFLAVAPYVFLVGLLMLLSAGTYRLHVMWESVIETTGRHGPLEEAALLGLVLLVGTVFALMVDANVFSLNAMYRNRLVRCYLGATNANRQRHGSDAFTGFDDGDDFDIAGLRGAQPDDWHPRNASSVAIEPVRPIWICNAALNVVSGKRLALQTRKAYNFVWTPWFSGYDPAPRPLWAAPDRADEGAQRTATRYLDTDSYAGGMTVGEAMSVSGAAVSPNMGYRTSPALNFLLTVFNVRLGGWYPNTAPNRKSSQRGPRFAALPLLRELLGRTDDENHFVYLSDGGHFENLGLYELVRRNCPVIVVSDAGHDANRTCPSLGNAIEKVRADFGVDIQIDTRSLTPTDGPQGSAQQSAWHCAVGRIRYDRVNPSARIGTLVYLKTSLTGDEPADVQAYAAANPEFPHQTTADQWFDENQFESYRALGEHVVTSVFEETVTRLRSQNEDAAASDLDLEQLAVRLRRRWFPPCPATADHFSSLGSRLDALFQQLRTTPELAFLDGQITPEWPDLEAGANLRQTTRYGLPENPESIRHGFYICNQMIQLMEDVYLDLELERHWEHPDNRGWMNLFRHWSWASMFRATWALSAATFGARFQDFCRRHLELDFGDLEARTVFSGSASELADSATELHEVNFAERHLLGDFARDRNDDDRHHEVVSFRFVVPDALPDDPTDNLPTDLTSTSDRDRLLTFRIGFAIVRESLDVSTDGGPIGDELVYLRIQDHLRKMGFARKSLCELGRARRLVRFASTDPWVARRVPTSIRDRFTSLFRSVQQSLRHRGQARTTLSPEQLQEAAHPLDTDGS